MRRRGLLTIVALLLAATALGVGCCTPGLIVASMTPGDAFDEAQTPVAPDYTRDAAWLALPTQQDEADVALPELPTLGAGEAQVDVFYLHPTSSVAARWNAPFDDAEVREASIQGGTLIQASAFNGCCAVYAPAYRQASGTAFMKRSPSAERAILVAYADVVAAWEDFSRRTGGERPFVLAGHSQGAVLAARLLKERIARSEAKERFVAAYLIGAPLTHDDLGGVPACTSPARTGCVVTYNARGPGHEVRETEITRGFPEEERLCVNPVLGAATTKTAPKERHGGAVFFDAAAPKVLPRFAETTCANGRLAVTKMQPLPDRGAMSGLLMWVMGEENYHPIEYQLFYVDLREDARRRVAAFLGGRASR